MNNEQATSIEAGVLCQVSKQRLTICAVAVRENNRSEASVTTFSHYSSPEVPRRQSRRQSKSSSLSTGQRPKHNLGLRQYGGGRYGNSQPVGGMRVAR